MGDNLTHDHTGQYFVRENGKHDFDVVQKSSGVVVASSAGKTNARLCAASINACAIVPRMHRPMVYRPFTKGCGSPDGVHKFFLLRPCGEHPRGGKYVPQPVQLIDGKLYTPDNEVEPLVWSLNGNFRDGPTDDPYQAKLEWMPLPDND